MAGLSRPSSLPIRSRGIAGRLDAQVEPAHDRHEWLLRYTMTNPSSALVRADAWTGVVLAVLGAVVAFEAWRMPRLEERGIDPYTEPGIVPGLLGLCLLLLGAILAVRAARAGGFAGPPVTREWLALESTRRLALAFALCLVYALGLVGRIHFTLASFLFLLAFMLLFGLRPREPGAARRAAIFVAIAAAAAGGVHVLFQELFLVRLP